jgi:hypothetical protein
VARIGKIPGVVEQAHDRKIERNDLRNRAPHTRKIRQVAHDRHGAPALLFESRLQPAELFTIASDQDDGAVLGYLKCGRTPNARGRAGDDDVCLTLGWIFRVGLHFQLLLCEWIA